jgi:hypothetical protein
VQTDFLSVLLLSFVKAKHESRKSPWSKPVETFRVENEFEMANSPKVLRKRKLTTYHDSEDSPSKYKEDSSDEEFEPAKKKSKIAKAGPKPRKRISVPSNKKSKAVKEGPKSRKRCDKNNNEFNSQKQMLQVGCVLASLKQEPGFGNCLKTLLPEIANLDAAAAFLCFIDERQKIWSNKKKGVEVLTTNHVLASKWFTNLYRELDRGTMYLRNQLNKTDLKEISFDKDNIDDNLVSKILLKSIIYRLINKVETFMDFGGVPDIDNFQGFLEFLHKKKSEGYVIFTAAHQNMGFKKLMTTFYYVKKNIIDLSLRIVSAAQNKSTKMCHTVLLRIPNVGLFLEWQILCDLLECKVLGWNTDNQWACLGPGAKNGLRRIFCLETTRGELKHTRLLRDLCRPKGPKSGFARLGLKFPAFLLKELSLKNVEHALCEYDKV